MTASLTPAPPSAPATAEVREIARQVRLSKSQHGGTYESSPFVYFPVGSVEKLLSAIDALPSLTAPASAASFMDGVEASWQSVSSAKRDGTRYILDCGERGEGNSGGGVHIGAYDPQDCCWLVAGVPVIPRRYMRLPPTEREIADRALTPPVASQGNDISRGGDDAIDRDYQTVPMSLGPDGQCDAVRAAPQDSGADGNEEVWIKRLHAQHDEISKLETAVLSFPETTDVRERAASLLSHQWRAKPIELAEALLTDCANYIDTIHKKYAVKLKDIGVDTDALRAAANLLRTPDIAATGGPSADLNANADIINLILAEAGVERSEYLAVKIAETFDPSHKLPCGHHPSLEIRSVESDYRACELCEARSMMRDAETMERRHRDERDTATARADALQQRVGALEEALKPFANVAELDIGSDESNNDIFQQMAPKYCQAPPITVGDLRRALATSQNEASR